MLIGEAAPLIEAALKPTGVPVVRVKSLGAAVEAAKERARPGDAVLLAPACSSYDMFSNYKERGEQFRSAVLSLGSSPSAGGGGAREAAVEGVGRGGGGLDGTKEAAW